MWQTVYRFLEMAFTALWEHVLSLRHSHKALALLFASLLSTDLKKRAFPKRYKKSIETMHWGLKRHRSIESSQSQGDLWLFCLVPWFPVPVSGKREQAPRLSSCQDLRLLSLVSVKAAIAIEFSSRGNNPRSPRSPVLGPQSTLGLRSRAVAGQAQRSHQRDSASDPAQLSRLLQRTSGLRDIFSTYPLPFPPLMRRI